MEQWISAIGCLFFLGVAYFLSEDKKAIQWPTVLWGMALQLLLALLILKTQVGQSIFQFLGQKTQGLLDFTKIGSQFIFGNLVDSQGSWGFLFFTMVLPTIIFMSSLMSALYHLGIMQRIVQVIAWLMMKTMKVSGAESLAAAANIFIGQTEAPLVIKPFISNMTRSEIMSLMTGGMATVAGGVLVAYVGFGVDATHLLAASVISAPAALVCAKIMVPEKEKSETFGKCHLHQEKLYQNVIEASAQGASDGLKLAANVAAMLLAFIALIAMLNALLGWFAGLFGFEAVTFESILGYFNAPFAFLMGVPAHETLKIGSLLGKKLVLNEFVGYVDLVAMKDELSPRAQMIATYALCGFANLSSIAIQIGGIGTLAPNKKEWIVKYGIKSLIAGTLACYLTACIAGLLVP